MEENDIKSTLKHKHKAIGVAIIVLIVIVAAVCLFILALSGGGDSETPSNNQESEEQEPELTTEEEFKQYEYTPPEGEIVDNPDQRQDIQDTVSSYTRDQVIENKAELVEFGSDSKNDTYTREYVFSILAAACYDAENTECLEELLTEVSDAGLSTIFIEQALSGDILITEGAPTQEDIENDISE